MKIDEQELEAHHVSRELIDGIEAIPGEVEHNLIVFATRLKDALAGLPAESAANIRSLCERAFLQRAADLLTRGGRLAPMVADVIAQAHESARIERERMRPRSPGEMFAPWSGRLDKLGWVAQEKTAIKSMLEQGEQVTAVDFRAVTTDRRTITRDDVRQWALGQRPRWLVELPGSMPPSEYLLRAGFPDAEAIEKLERVAAHVEAERARPAWNASPDSAAGPNARPR